MAINFLLVSPVSDKFKCVLWERIFHLWNMTYMAVYLYICSSSHSPLSPLCWSGRSSLSGIWQITVVTAKNKQENRTQTVKHCFSLQQLTTSHGKCLSINWSSNRRTQTLIIVMTGAPLFERKYDKTAWSISDTSQTQVSLSTSVSLKRENW